MERATMFTDKNLKVICMEFRKGICGRKKSNGMCAKVSWALQGYLSFLGLQTRVRIGDVGQWNHFWLELPNGTVIDATADQFSTEKKKYPAVYIGKPLKIHVPSESAEEKLLP